MSDIAALARGVILTGLTEPPRPVWAGFAGYLMFSRNGSSAADLRDFTDSIRERCADRPLIAIDQEGGRVARLERGVETIPSMMALGATGDAELARRAGEQIAFDLRRAGCTLDFAPVLDLALDSA
ncbi:MAG: glycoside hydrolase family 3 N-terminal domain-containing protein, partial [Candidatus Cybelea sp.]